ALLIGNGKYKNQPAATQDLGAVARSLEQYGFRCRVVENLENEYAFRDAIERFARQTPTRSTALLYYRGRLGDGPSLLATDSRGKYLLAKALQALSEKGAAGQHLVFLDAPEAVDFQGELPEAFQLTLGETDALLAKLDGKTDLIASLAGAGKNVSTLAKTATLIGKGSRAISSRDAFMPGEKPGDEWVNSMGVVFCWCPSGKYLAGSPPEVPGRYADEEQREVVIEHGFWFSKYELARGQEVAKRRPGNNTLARHKLEPMTMINHDDAKTMVRNFTASERKAGRLPSDWEYNLPAEDQWEYAARAGTTTRYSFGDDVKLLPRHANFADKSYYDTGDVFSNAAHRTLDDGAARLARVGSYPPNARGLHDVHGNVAEWCVNLAIRGGSWVSVPENCRGAYRDSFSSRNEQNFIGYRLVIQKTPSGK
ncbi:MAG: SUMF1/EgtB/PvdO family nonheme iron enzyme, partial [Planctomycetales bacterium]